MRLTMLRLNADDEVRQMVNMKTEPTPEQLTALRDYAARYGRTWKAALRHEWMNACQGISDLNQQALLQQVRNTLGPSWLVSFRLTAKQ